jgi:hypothetical protein
MTVPPRWLTLRHLVAVRGGPVSQEQLDGVLTENENLRAALREVASMLGDGACAREGCEGCRCKVAEAAGIANEAQVIRP